MQFGGLTWINWKVGKSSMKLNLREFIDKFYRQLHTLSRDELARERMIANLSLFGLLSILLMYVVFLFMPYTPPTRTEKGLILILRGVYMRKFKGESLQWWLRARKFTYDENGKRGTFFDGSLYLLGRGILAGKMDFHEAYTDRRKRMLRIFNARLLYERSVIYSERAYLIRSHLYMYNCIVYDLDNPYRLMLSPRGELYQRKLKFDRLSVVDLNPDK